MREHYLVAKHARMTIRIVPSSRFIASIVDERRARVARPDTAIAESAYGLLDAIACTTILGTFAALVAAIGYIFLNV